MKVYLASRFSRKTELREYRIQLEQAGIEVTSRWLNTGAHEWEGTPDHEIPPHVQGLFALEDLTDIANADVLVAFTEPAGTGPSRGGRWVEFGYALARGKTILVVGPQENIFTCLPQVMVAPDWAHAYHILGNAMADASSVGVAS